MTISSYPTCHITQAGESADGPTILGLSLYMTLGPVEPVKLYEEPHWLGGQAGVRIHLLSADAERLDEGLPHDGLVLTREWFTGAVLDEDRANLRVFVFANTGAEPFYPPVGQERDPDEKRDAFLHDLVGWGFAFDFDGSPPYTGRWADWGEKS